MTNVLLLRASSSQEQTSSPDRYESVFASANYQPISINPLETVLTNLDELGSIIAAGPGGELNCQGVVVTSSRACEAWASAIGILHSKPHRPTPSGASGTWHEPPFYVVGESTASQLSAISKTCGASSPYVPTIIRGAGSGTGEQLAQFILQDLGEKRPVKLLYLTGDKNKDTIPKILNSGGVELKELQVYATQGSSSFEGDLEIALSKAPQNIKWWIVYFAPSSSQFVFPILQKHFTFLSHDFQQPLVGLTQANSISRPLPQPRIAAIGPTTLTFLRNSLKLQVDATAKKPTPDDLLAAIIATDPNELAAST